MSFDYRDVSVWVEEPADLQPALDAELRCDVAIVGGGLTGLNAALALRAEGVDVVLLEMDFCGKGASGRNAGHLTPAIGKDVPTLVKQVGAARAAEYIGFGERAVRHTQQIFERYGIDCDYRPVGNIIAGVHPRHTEPLQRSAELAAGIGAEVRYLNEDEMRARKLPPVFRVGVLESCGGHLHPGKYVLGLRRAALSAGVRIFEATPVTGIEDGASPIKVLTPRGMLRADKLIVATNAYTPSTLKRLKSKVFPLRDTMFQTARLTDAQLDRLGWTGREGVYTAHESLESYRITADGRLVGGSKHVQYGYNGALIGGNDPALFQKFADLFKVRFPEVPDLAIESFWGGWICMTLDFLPLSFGNARGDVFYGLGYNGHGVAQATLNGTMLADQVLGRPNEDVALLKRRVFPLPPEPLRWLALHALKWRLGRTDGVVDADLRRGIV